MKYYVYISENKIEMLFSQIVKSDDEKREATLGFDLKILKGELKEARGIPDNKFSKLESLVKRLEKENLIGSVHEKSPYIKGVLDLTWASFGFRGDSPITFWGFISDEFILGLAGSRHHVLGEQPEGKAHSHSLTSSITRWLLDEFGDIPLDVRELFEYNSMFPKPLRNDDVSNAVELAVTQMSGQINKFEFVAKVLHREPYPYWSANQNKDTILATPLYVALVE